MTTVVRRAFRSTPERDAARTWTDIVDLLTLGNVGDARTELLRVAGVATSVIADKSPKDAAIIVTCDGTRTRIYCLYDDDAIEGSEANEATLGFDPLNGDWHVSLPCQADDLSWVQAALKTHSNRITARDPEAAAVNADRREVEAAPVLVFDPKGFLGS